MPQRIQWILLSLRKSRWLRSNSPPIARCVCVAQRKTAVFTAVFFALSFSVAVT